MSRTDTTADATGQLPMISRERHHATLPTGNIANDIRTICNPERYPNNGAPIGIRTHRNRERYQDEENRERYPNEEKSRADSGHADNTSDIRTHKNNERHQRRDVVTSGLRARPLTTTPARMVASSPFLRSRIRHER